MNRSKDAERSFALNKIGVRIAPLVLSLLTALVPGEASAQVSQVGRGRQFDVQPRSSVPTTRPSSDFQPMQRVPDGSFSCRIPDPDANGTIVLKPCVPPSAKSRPVFTGNNR